MPLDSVAGTPTVFHICNLRKPACRHSNAHFMLSKPVEGSLEHGPQSSLPPGIHAFILSLSLNVHWTYWLTSKGRIEYTTSDRIPLSRSRKRQWLLSCLPNLSLLLSLVYSKGRQLPCCKLPYREAHVLRNWCLEPIVCKDLRPTNNQRDELGSRSLPSWALRRLKPWLSPWLQPYEGPWARGTHLCQSWIPDSQRECNVHSYCWKLLSFRVNCFAAIDNIIPLLPVVIRSKKQSHEEGGIKKNRELSDWWIRQWHNHQSFTPPESALLAIKQNSNPWGRHSPESYRRCRSIRSRA